MIHCQTAVVILNYNGSKFLHRFLPSVIQYTPEDIEIVVIDNLSSDDSLEVLKNEFPHIKCICLNKNFGFAGGYNEGLKQIKADYFFLLNSDVQLIATWHPMLEKMKKEPLLAACQPKIISLNQTDHFEHAGAAGGWIDSLGYPFCRGRVLDQFEKDTGQYDKDAEIFWASGAAMLVNAKFFQQLGGFDSDYFAHMEEIDWCWRAKKMGWSIKCLPSVTVWHLGGGTLPYNSTQKIYLNFRNNLATMIKNAAASSLFYLIPIRLAMDTLAAVVFLLKGQINASIAIFRGYFHCLRWIPSLIQKRKEINLLSKNLRMNSVGIFKGSIIFNYYIRKNRTFQAIVNE